MQIGIAEEIQSSWQDTVELLTEIAGVSAAAVKRIVGQEIDILATNQSADNTLRRGLRDRLTGSNAFCAAVTATQTVLEIEDALSDSRWKDSPDLKRGFRSYLGMPLRWPDGTCFGTICLFATESRIFSPLIQRLMGQSRKLIELQLAAIFAQAGSANGRVGAQDQIGDSLRLSEERFRLLIEHAADDYFLHDDKGRILDVNQGSCISTGYTREELLNMNIGDFSFDLSRDEKEAIWMRTPPGHTATVHARHCRKDGSFFPVQIRIFCYLSGGQKLFLSLVRNISEPEDAERGNRELNKRLKQSAQERTGRWSESFEVLQAVMDAAADAVFLKDLDGKFLVLNRATAELAGLDIDQVIGKTASELFGAETSGPIRQQELDVISSGEPITVEETIVVNGKPILFATTRSAYRDENGTIIGVIGISRDISEMRRAVEGPHASESRWQFAVDGAGDGIWDWDVNTGKVFYSRQWKAMLGYDDDELGDTTDAWSNLIHPEDIERCWQTVNSHLQGYAPSFILEHRLLAKDGSYHWILGRGKVIARNRNGDPIRVIGTHTDITSRKAQEEEMAAREQWLSAMVENLPIGAIFVSGDQLRINLAGEKITGYERHELATREEWFRKLCGDKYESLMAVYLEDRANNFDEPTQIPFYRKDGSLRLAEFAATLVGEHEIWLMRDITEDQELQKQLSVLTDNVPNGAIYRMVESPDGDLSYSYMSAGISALVGVAAAEVMRNPQALRQTIHEDDLSRVQKEEQRSRLSGGVFDCQFRHRTRDGRIVWLHCRSALHRNADGATVWDGVMVDITARKRAEDGIVALNERFQLAIEAARIGIWELDFATGKFLWDERMHSLYNLKPGEFDGTLDHWRALLHPQDEPGVMQNWEVAQAGTSVFEDEFRVLTDQDEQRYVRARAQVYLKPDGSPFRALGVNWDVTAERQAKNALLEAKEAAETAERAKSEFLAMMSHEVRTPMNTIIGMTHLVLQSELNPRQRNYLDKIDASANNLVAILNDILDFSKIEAGKLELEEVEFALHSVLESVTIVTSMKAEEKGLEIAYDVAADVPPRLIGDPLRLGQVLINLVNNAVKFTHAGEIVVTIKQGETSLAGLPMLEVSVRDSGIGLSADQIAGLFRTYSQGDSETSRRYGGTGLGLAICKRLVNLMGGEIGVISEPGVGSNFYFTFEAKPPAAVARPLRQDPPTMELKDRRVLVVDDNASARDILGAMVRHFGMETVVADSGPIALSYVKQALEENHPFELVLMDWRMPEMDGLETAQRIKSFNQWQSPAVLMVTAYGREDVLYRAEQLGLQGVLVKPVTESVLFDTITGVLGDRAAARMPITSSAAPARTERALPTGKSLSALSTAFPVLDGKRVLVVEDNAMSREVVSDFLTVVGIQVDTAANGLEALTRLKTSSYDAVLMDMHMPEMDGLAATQEIRRHERWRLLPIIALTAQTRPEDRKAALAAGMSAHLTKPINETTLYTTLSQLLLEAEAAGAAPARPGSRTGLCIENEIEDSVIDVTFALERLGGERERLSRLLRGFVRDFSGVPAQLAQDYRLGHTTAIASCAHTVRGAASYLDAHELCSVAERLEDCARQGDADRLRQNLPVFVERLKMVLGQVETLLASMASQDSIRLSGPIDVRAILKILKQVEPLVARGDYAAEALLDELTTRLSGTQHAFTVEDAHADFEELELDRAVDTLRSLKADLEQAMSGELS